MSILDFFSVKSDNNSDSNNNQNNDNNQNNQNNNNLQQSQQKASDQNDTKSQNANNPAKDSENPFDKYKELFDNAAKKSEFQAPSFSLDPKVVSEVAASMDFTKGVNPELIQKASSGDAAAMMKLIGEVGRNTYRASLEHAAKLTDTHLGQRSDYESKRLQKGVKEQLTSDALSANTNFNHPVIKAELNRIAKQFAESDEYADASPQEIANAAKKYIVDLNAAMNPESNKSDSKKKPAEIDYMKYILGE
jgi:hypothetical protein